MSLSEHVSTADSRAVLFVDSRYLHCAGREDKMRTGPELEERLLLRREIQTHQVSRNDLSLRQKDGSGMVLG